MGGGAASTLPSIQSRRCWAWRPTWRTTWRPRTPVIRWTNAAPWRSPPRRACAIHADNPSRGVSDVAWNWRRTGRPRTGSSRARRAAGLFAEIAGAIRPRFPVAPWARPSSAPSTRRPPTRCPKTTPPRTPTRSAVASIAPGSRPAHASPATTWRRGSTSSAPRCGRPRAASCRSSGLPHNHRPRRCAGGSAAGPGRRALDARRQVSGTNVRMTASQYNWLIRRMNEATAASRCARRWLTWWKVGLRRPGREGPDRRDPTDSGAPVEGRDRRALDRIPRPQPRRHARPRDARCAELQPAA